MDGLPMKIKEEVLFGHSEDTIWILNWFLTLIFFTVEKPKLWIKKEAKAAS